MKKLWMALCLISVCAWAAEESGSVEPKTITLDDGSQITLQTDYKVTLKQKVNPRPQVRKMAVFIKNTAGEQFNAAVDRLRTQITAQCAGSNIEIMDYTETVMAIAPMADPDKPTDDAKLLANTSITRLAENMGADYVLVLSLDRFSKNVKTLKNKYLRGPIKNEIYKISASYKVLDAYSGTAIGGGTLHAQQGVRQTDGVQIEFGDYADALEEQLATEMSDEIKSKEAEWRVASIEVSGIKVTFNVTAYDMNNQPIYLPKYDGERRIVNDRIPATVAATVEVDGVTKGTTTCTVALSPGLHKVRFVRQGYDDLTMMIKPVENQNYTTSMRMTDAEYARIKDTISFMHTLTMERELNQAEVKRLEGEAKRLEQSGIRVDAKELPEVQLKTLY